MPIDTILSEDGVIKDGILTVYVKKGEACTAPEVLDADGNPILVWYDMNGEEVTEFVVGGAYTYKSFIYGDCDGDGKVDTIDLAALKLFLAGSGEVELGADCDGDGKVNTTDLAALKLFLAGAGTLGPQE